MLMTSARGNHHEACPKIFCAGNAITNFNFRCCWVTLMAAVMGQP
jgi:hypothetical protein